MQGLAADLPDSEMLGGLYDAAAGLMTWADALKPLGRELGAGSGILYIEDEAGTVELLATPGWSVRAVQLYAAHFHLLDPYAAFARRSPEATCVLGHEIVTPAQLRESELWRDFGRLELPGFHFIGAIMPLENGEGARMGWHRPEDAASFDEVSRACFQRLTPHLRRALQLRQRLEQTRQDARMCSMSLDSIALGVVVVTRAGQVRYANAAAERICAGPCGLRLDGRLHAMSRTDDVRLSRLMHQAASGEAGGGLLIGPTLPECRIAVLACPLPPGYAGRSHYFCAAGITNFISAPRAAGGSVLVTIRTLAAGAAGLNPELLRNLFDLSQAEATIAAALTAGATIAEVAAARCTSHLTVRAQIRQILAKAGVGTLRDFTTTVSRVLSS